MTLFVTNEKWECNNKMNFRKTASNSETSVSTAVRTSHICGYNTVTETYTAQQ